MEQRSEAKSNIDKYCIEKMNNNLCSVINKEMRVDIEIKIEESEDFETDIILLGPDCDKHKNFNGTELYQNHVIKDELAIGPDTIKENFIEVPLHSDDILQCNQTEIYQCTNCKESFQTKESLLIHSQNIHRLKLCQFCLKGFNKTSNLNRHQTYACRYNESVAKNNEMLKYGMYTHPFICDYCKKTYTHKNSLREHIRTHIGVPNNFQCKYCDKSYTKRHNLTCHIRSTHLKVKAYLCKYCKKRFNWRYGLTSHLKTMHQGS